MKKIKAYAILNKKGGLLLFDHRLPLYWNSKVARNEANKWSGFNYYKKRDGLPFIGQVEVSIIKIPSK